MIGDEKHAKPANPCNCRERERERESRSLTATAVLACLNEKISLQTRKLHIIYRRKIKRHEYNAQKTVF